MEGEAREGAAHAFTAYRWPLYMVSSLRYLGRMLAAVDGNWTEVVGNLIKDHHKWAQLARIIGSKGVDARTLGRFYVAAVQETLLFGLDM